MAFKLLNESDESLSINMNEMRKLTDELHSNLFDTLFPQLEKFTDHQPMLSRRVDSPQQFTDTVSEIVSNKCAKATIVYGEATSAADRVQRELAQRGLNDDGTRPDASGSNAIHPLEQAAIVLRSMLERNMRVAAKIRVTS